ncbi:P3C2G kinase, partial [Polyodon spathula]|nr:P3C2G kinase [Polyodon spathula]
MLNPTGHLLHIDFARFLGHTQRFANIKRDRAPFIFTSEMHYFLTEGGRNPRRFQCFVELCCQTYNIIRRHTQLFMSLLELVRHRARFTELLSPGLIQIYGSIISKV